MSGDTSNSVSDKMQDHCSGYDDEKYNHSDSSSQDGSIIIPWQKFSFRRYCARNLVMIIWNTVLTLAVVIGLIFAILGYSSNSRPPTNNTIKYITLPCNMTALSPNEDVLDNNSHIIVQLDGIVNSLNDFQNQLGLLTIQVNALQIQTRANVSHLENTLSDTSEQIANISVQFQSLQSSLAPYQEVDDHLSSFNSSLSNLSVQFTTFATNFNSQLSSLNSSHKSQASELQSLQSDLSTLTSRVSDIPQEISNSFEQRFSDVDSQIISIEFTANRALRKADANEDKLDNLEDRVNGATRIIPYNSYSFLVSLCFVLILLLLSD